MKMDGKINIKIESNLNVEIGSNLNLEMDGVLSLSNNKKKDGWSGGCESIEVRIEIEKFFL